jgi:uncharacterized protein YbaR (Trm112 family)
MEAKEIKAQNGMLVDPDLLDLVVCPKCGGKLEWRDKESVLEVQSIEVYKSPEDELEEDYSEEAACLQCSKYFSATPSMALKIRVDES